MRILLLSPPSLSSKNVIRDAIYGCWCQGKRIGGAQTPPYPLLLVATILQKEEHYVKVIDAQAEGKSINNLLDVIHNFQIVLISTSVMTFSEDAEVLRKLKETNSELINIIFGAQPTFMSEYSLKKESIDIIIIGEPEFIIRDLINEIENGRDWKNIKGIGYKESGKIIINDKYPLIENLDELPFVNWSLLPKNVSYFNPTIQRYPYVTDLTTRGCPFRCIFCMSPEFYGKKVRARSADNVLEGFKKHIREGYKEVYLRDEMFTTPKVRNKSIFQEMIKNKMDLTWICSARVDSIDYDDMKLMKEAGCHTIKFGVESGVQEILDRSKKQIKLDDTRRAFKNANKLGINSHAHVIIGLPGEKKETIEETIKFVKKLEPTTATFAIVTPYPGTPLFDEVAERYPEIKEGFSLSVRELHSTSFFTHTFCELTAEELHKYVLICHRKFYLRLKYLWNWLKRIKNLSELKKVIRAGTKIIDYSIRGE